MNFGTIFLKYVWLMKNQIHMENGMQKPQAFFSVQRFRRSAQTFEVVDDVRLDSFQPGSGGFNAVRLNVEGEKLGFRQTVAALRHLVFQHGGVFDPAFVVRVSPQGNGDALFKSFRSGSQVHEGELEVDGRIEVVQELAPVFKDGFLVLVLRQLIVDILKLDGFGIVVVVDAAHAVLIHPLVWNGLLCRQLLFICALCPFDGCGDLPLFFPCEPALFL